jgi:hypothetical protein
MPVDAILDPGQPYGGRAYRDCITAARAHHVPIVTAYPEMRWSSGDGLALEVLAPGRPFLADTGDDVNENSIVAMLHYRVRMGASFERSSPATLARRANRSCWPAASIFAPMC